MHDTLLRAAQQSTATAPPTLDTLCNQLAIALAGKDDELAKDLIGWARTGDIRSIQQEAEDYLRTDAEEAHTPSQHEAYRYQVKAAFTALRDAIKGGRR